MFSANPLFPSLKPGKVINEPSNSNVTHNIQSLFLSWIGEENLVWNGEEIKRWCLSLHQATRFQFFSVLFFERQKKATTCFFLFYFLSHRFIRFIFSESTRLIPLKFSLLAVEPYFASLFWFRFSSSAVCCGVSEYLKVLSWSFYHS